LYRGLRNASGVDELKEIILDEMALIRNEMRGIKFCRSDNEKSNFTFNPFWMSNEEREGLFAAIRLGAYEAINTLNYPALDSISRQEVNELKCMAISERLIRLETIKGQRKTSLQGFVGIMSDQDPIIGDINSKIKKLLSLQKEIYFEGIIVDNDSISK